MQLFNDAKAMVPIEIDTVIGNTHGCFVDRRYIFIYLRHSLMLILIFKYVNNLFQVFFLFNHSVTGQNIGVAKTIYHKIHEH